jgi:hypothetical protein
VRHRASEVGLADHDRLEGQFPIGELFLKAVGARWPGRARGAGRGRRRGAAAWLGGVRALRRGAAVPPVGHRSTYGTVLGLGVGIVAGQTDAHQLTGAFATRLECGGMQPPAAGEAFIALLFGAPLAWRAVAGQRYIA